MEQVADYKFVRNVALTLVESVRSETYQIVISLGSNRRKTKAGKEYNHQIDYIFRGTAVKSVQSAIYCTAA